jgi:hypothetical protein
LHITSGDDAKELAVQLAGIYNGSGDEESTSEICTQTQAVEKREGRVGKQAGASGYKY